MAADERVAASGRLPAMSCRGETRLQPAVSGADEPGQPASVRPQRTEHARTPRWLEKRVRLHLRRLPAQEEAYGREGDQERPARVAAINEEKPAALDARPLANWSKTLMMSRKVA